MITRERWLPPGMILVLLVIAAAVLPSGTETNAAGPAPLDVRVTDVTDQSFVVSWRTASVATGAVRVWPCADQASAPTIMLDLRDQEASRSTPTLTSTVHYVRVVGLQPSTLYCFDILSGDTRYGDGGVPYVGQTGPTLGVASPGNTLFGMVLAPDGSPAVETIVFVTLVDGDGQGAQSISAPLSALVTMGGFWSVGAGNARTADLAQTFSYRSCTERSTACDSVMVSAIAGGGERWTVALPIPSDLAQPLPAIQLRVLPYHHRLPLVVRTITTTNW